MSRFRRCLLAIGIALATTATVATPGVSQSNALCFADVGHCVDTQVRAFWEENGGLETFGFPLGPLRDDFVDGKPVQAQWFERARLELQADGSVGLGRLGNERLAMLGRDWRTLPPGAEQDGCIFFSATRHGVCPPFIDFWRSRGVGSPGDGGPTEDQSIALFGVALAEPALETIAGEQVLVQWFERARFERRGSEIKLGSLGTELFPRMPPTYVPPAPTSGPEPASPPARSQPAPAPVVVVNIGGATPRPGPSAGLKIVNNTGDVARVSLSGPTNGNWPLSTGQTFEPQVDPGAYQLIVSATCGGSAQSFTIAAGSSRELALTCPQVPTGVLRALNRTGGQIKLSVNGPVAYAWHLGDSDSLEQRLPPGEYSSSVVTRCGGKTSTVTIKTDAIAELTWECPQATVRLVNNTGGVARVTLNGGTSGGWSLANGQTQDVRVAPGEYAVSVDAQCGQRQDQFAVGAGDIKEYEAFCPPPQPPEAVGGIRIINNTGATLSVTASGPTRMSWTVTNGQVIDGELPVGTYTVTAQARCGSRQDVAQIAAGGTSEHSYGCG